MEEERGVIEETALMAVSVCIGGKAPSIRLNLGAENDKQGKFKGRQREMYQIRVKGHLDNRWSEWFNGLTVTHDKDGTTVLVGPVVDQAALYGLLIKARDLGLSLLSVNRIDAPQDGFKHLIPGR